MKQKFTFKTIFIALSSMAIFSTVQAQDPFQVQWTLLTDSMPSVSGNAVATPQFVSTFLAPKRYARSFDGSPATSTGWQGKGEGQAWPAGFDATVYDEYKIKPSAGNSLKVTQFQLSVLGGGTGSMRLAVYYSKNNFVTFDSLSLGSNSGGTGGLYNGGTTYRATSSDPIVLLNTSTTGLAGKEVATFPSLNINLNPGDSLVIRTIPFLTASGNRYYPSKLVTITGTTQTSGAVPVIFSSVSASAKNSGVQVNWTTAQEVNTDRYAVEKSNDGHTFSEAGSVQAKGNSNVSSNYTWYDATPNAGNTFYRIKSVDKDGKVKYTNVLKVSLSKGASDIVVSPNPVRGGVMSLQMNNLLKGLYTLNLFNSAGQRVFTKQVSHDGGSATQTIQLTSLKQGVYTLQLSNGSVNLNKSVVVE